jgi:hypothetical protein
VFVIGILREVPVPSNGLVVFSCPGLKSFENKSELQMRCSTSTNKLEWVGGTRLTWPECACVDKVVNSDKCPEMHSISTKYAESDGESEINCFAVGRLDSKLV